MANAFCLSDISMLDIYASEVGCFVTDQRAAFRTVVRQVDEGSMDVETS